tara:strand:- start:297 stop:1271 length:975 start_codon:yes stop_codon:yes gene_type:complete
MIIVTGGAGFIGSAYVWKCNQKGIKDIVIVDNLNTSTKWLNLRTLTYQDYIHKDNFINLIKNNKIEYKVKAIIHMGACSSTTEMNSDYLMENNYRYTKLLANWSLKNNVRFIYASSAATYGDGEKGFDDDHNQMTSFSPINPYGYSKHLFDLVAKEEGILDKIVGLKFFNVFGPNEYHKESMRSVVCKAHHQILESNEIKLFKSYNDQYEDGGQKRDFIYIKDCIDIIDWFVDNPDKNGIFNVGTGEAKTWNQLAQALFKALKKEPNINYIDMPDNIKNQYQYFTQANMGKLKDLGYSKPFFSLEDAVEDYVSNYLNKQNRYLS